MKKLISILSLVVLFTACSQSGDQNITTTEDTVKVLQTQDSCSAEVDSTKCCKDSL